MSGSLIERWMASLPRALGRWQSAGQILDRIRVHARALTAASDAELQATFGTLRKCVGNGRTHQALVAPAFAAVCEAVRRSLGLELFDVQLRAGLAVARGQIAELPTGEGKTLAVAPPAFLRAVTDRAVHVVAPNSYLARRDYELLKDAYGRLGCRAGLLPESAPELLKRQAYACDITYGTGYEFGFDYLREQLAALARRKAPLGNRYRLLLDGNREADSPAAYRAFAIIDEIDSVLIDEASTPLILSDSPSESAVPQSAYEYALRVACTLGPDRDFTIDPSRSRAVTLTAHGRRQCYQALRGEPAAGLAGPWAEFVQQGLQALHGLRRDVDYVVQGQKVIVVDASTGRLCPDRSWRNGLQQFLEIKEGLPVTLAQTTAARITRQRYFSLYSQLSGMTGTALESAAEFRQTYGLRIEAIPPRLPCRRSMLPERVFATSESCLRAVATEIGRAHATGRPVLVGCRTIENSERLARRLESAGIEFQLLNGKQTAAEAEIVARAGQRGAITIATNMAGRGTDIKLGRGMAEIGGMHLIAIERNESQRVDRQLIGRVARQGDPGSCQFFVSADDALLAQFAPPLCQQIRSLPNVEGEVSKDLTRPIRDTQRRAERANFSARRELAAADIWLFDELCGLLE